MNFIYKSFCRTFQFCFRIAMPFLPYRKPTIFTNVKECVPLFQKLNIKSVLLVTDQGIRSAGITKPLEEYLEENQIKCVVYDSTRANPTVQNVEESKSL